MLQHHDCRQTGKEEALGIGEPSAATVMPLNSQSTLDIDLTTFWLAARAPATIVELGRVVAGQLCDQQVELSLHLLRHDIHILHLHFESMT